MQLTIQNFRPIKTANNIILKPITLLAGPNNTGKSYTAKIIYITKQTFEKQIQGMNNNYEETNVIKRENTTNKNSECIKTIQENITQIIAQYNKELNIEARRCFGEQWEHIINDQTIIKISNNNKTITFDMLNEENNTFKNLTNLIMETYTEIEKECKREDDEIFTEEIYQTLINKINTIIQTEFNNNTQNNKNEPRKKTHYIPDNRGYLINNYTEITTNIIKNAPTLGLKTEQRSNIKYTEAHFIQRIIEMMNQNKNEAMVKHEKEIEKHILNGKIIVVPSPTGYPIIKYEITNNNKTQTIPINKTSTTVSETAAIILFMQYYLKENSTLIIEEPETALHPHAQRYMAKLLVALANMNIQIIATTHSDIIMEQISNFAHANELKYATVLNKTGQKQTINKDKINLYEFKQTKNNQSTVKPTIFNAHTGYLTDCHLKVSTDLYNETVNLHNEREIEKNKEKQEK